MTEGGWRATCSAQRTERKNRNLVLKSSKYRVLRREKEPERRSGAFRSHPIPDHERYVT